MAFIPIATWVIGEGIAWATAAEVAAGVAGVAVAAATGKAIGDNIAQRKADLKEVDYIADEYGLDRHEFSDAVHDHKRRVGRKGKSIPRRELREIAESMGGRQGKGKGRKKR